MIQPSRLAGLAVVAVLLLVACDSKPAGVPLVFGARGATSERHAATGPLRVLPSSPRYFTDGSDRAVFLTGSHTWNNFQDWGASDPPPAFDYAEYLDFLEAHGHNFIRLYVWEQAAWLPWEKGRITISPLPYVRTGPGAALDGKPRFDLHRFDQAYFDRLRDRVKQAGDRGIYVSVMLFDGWSIEDKRWPEGNPWKGHPLNRENNVNGIDGDPNDDGQGLEAHTLSDPEITRMQKAYVAKVIDTVGDLDNVLWEISNESHALSTPWQYEMIRFVQAYESNRPKQHPVGMTAQYPGGRNEDLFRSAAAWIAPHDSAAEPYRSDPPASDGRKVIVADTDHVWGIGGEIGWVWKSLTRGLCPIFMDTYKSPVLKNEPILDHEISTDEYRRRPPLPEFEPLRRNLGYARAYAERIDLAHARPDEALASSGFCLANPGVAYLIFLPAQDERRLVRIARLVIGPRRERVSVELSGFPQVFNVEWFDPGRGVIVAGGSVAGGRRESFDAPFPGDAVLYLTAKPAPDLH